MTDKDLLQDAKERYKESSDGWRDIYDEAKADTSFVYDVGEGQWPDAIKKERGNRPIITVNKLQKFVRQLRGDAALNRPRIKVIPVDSKADPGMAELYNGIIRQIEYKSSAEIAYDTAYGGAIAGSIGFFRLITKYADDTSFDQDIFIKRILDPLSVHFDPNAVEFTFEDAQYCFIEDIIKKADFKRKYPGADLSHFEGKTDLLGEWISDDNVRIAEYFYKEPVKKQIVLLNTGEVVEVTKENPIDLIVYNGGQILKERTVSTHVVRWAKISGFDVLEKSDWPGIYIPVIPVLGDEIVVDGKRHYLSLARGAKGPQQMFNFWATAATENVALSPKAPFIVDHRQIKGFEGEWEESNRSNRMYLRYNAVAGVQKPQREAQSQVPNAIIGMLNQTAFDIEDHLGRYESSKGMTSNERSGKAIQARINQSDKGTYTFVDNLSRAIIYAGRQMIDLVPKIYDTERALQIQGEDGSQMSVTVNQPTMDAMGNVVKMNDLSVGKYDLIATTGASYGSKREEMVQQMIEAMQYAPTVAPAIAPLIFKYSDWPGADEVAASLQQMIQQQSLMGEQVA